MHELSNGKKKAQCAETEMLRRHKTDRSLPFSFFFFLLFSFETCSDSALCQGRDTVQPQIMWGTPVPVYRACGALGLGEHPR